MCVFMCICVYVYKYVSMYHSTRWRSEDNWGESVLSVHRVHPGHHELQVLRLGVRHLCPPSMSSAQRVGSSLLINKGSAGETGLADS